MDSANDLLSDYVKSGSDAAFAEMVKRYVDFVYSVAARRLGDPHHEAIQDVIQTVFVGLAQKAGTLRKESNLGGWLHRHTCFVTSKYLRSEQQRLKRERAAAEDNPSGENATWSGLAIVIDDAIQLLKAPDRTVILMRFFEGKDFKTIGASLGTNEDAAQKRVSRAIEKLRAVLFHKGSRVGGMALASLLAAHSIQAAPAELGFVVAENIRRTTLKVPPRSGGLRMPLKLIMGGLAVMGGLFLVLFPTGSPRSVPPIIIQNHAPGVLHNEPAPATKTELIAFSAQASKQLSLKVVDKISAQPISDVTLNLRLFTDLHGIQNLKSATDERGLAVIELPTEVGKDFHFRIRLSKDGYVDRYVSWSVFQKDSREDIPSEYTATLSRGINIGGFVRNMEGEPIVGVAVVFSGPSPVGIPPRERDTVMGSYHKEFTGAMGQWQCTHAPDDYVHTTFELQHPDYMTTTYAMTGTDLSDRQILEIPPVDFLSGKADMRMDHGMALRGLVLDEKGLPVIAAKVIPGARFNEKQFMRLTDPNGSFQFHNCATGSQKVTILARGFAPFSGEVLPMGNERQIEFKLVASKGLRGDVVDQSGAAISKAEVQTASDDYQRRQDWDWDSKTDANGSFFWDSSPNEKIRITFSATGFERRTEELQPGELPNKITLIAIDSRSPEYRRMRLQVVSTQTSQPVADAEVTLREYVTSGAFSPSIAGKTDPEGQIDLKLASDTKSFDFEVRANSFKPEAFPNLAVSNAPPEMTIQLTPGAAGIEGWLILPSGDAAVRAEVGLLTVESSLSLGRRQFRFRNDGIRAYTDEAGRFAFPAQSDLLSIIAVHPSGSARIEAVEWKNGSKIQLQPYATIRGTFILNGKHDANAEIGLFCTKGMLSYDKEVFSAKTDDNGNFTFSDVPPGPVKLIWLWSMNRGRSGNCGEQSFQIEAGVENAITFEVAGRPLYGKLTNPADAYMDWTGFKGTLFLKNDRGEIVGGEGMKTFVLKVNSDGTFSSPAVPPGAYYLMAEKAMRPSKIQNANSGPRSFALEKVLIIPQGQGGVDVGPIPVSNASR